MVKLIFKNEKHFGDRPIKLDIKVYEDSSLNNSVQTENIEITKLLLAHKDINVNFNENLNTNDITISTNFNENLEPNRNNNRVSKNHKYLNMI